MQNSPRSQAKGVTTQKVGQKKLCASEAVKQFLPEKISRNTRIARIKELMKWLSDDECTQHVLPRLCKSVSPAQFFLKCCENLAGITRLANVAKEYFAHQTFIYVRFPELRSCINIPISKETTTQVPKEKQLTDLLQKNNRQQVCEWLMKKESENVIKQSLPQACRF